MSSAKNSKVGLFGKPNTRDLEPKNMVSLPKYSEIQTSDLRLCLMPFLIIKFARNGYARPDKMYLKFI